MATTSESQEIALLQQDVKRRQYDPPDPERMADIVSRLFARRGYARVLSKEDYQQVWRTVVGDVVASQTRVGNLRGGVLQIVAANSTIIQELSFRKHQILVRLKQELPHQRIRNVRLTVGSIE
jgi:predicted nucleic acid-binding Zn ribbon protein